MDSVVARAVASSSKVKARARLSGPRSDPSLEFTDHDERSRAKSSCTGTIQPNFLGLDATCLAFPLDLVPVLLQDDTDQLTARPNSGLGKELLKGGFNRALGDSYPRRNFFVREAL